ncbi:uncharacterized protein BT62DRAFT_957411 [Guyanagaster necrorhizus]|uniref:Ribosomal protein S6 n=1 Tax=Guyanagaster necrorhizus TaxID=856835 RepID=A0A9P7VHE7_9AGAR|nr:uncharacterized protein BT62DRAFT_957411 [Guyanagaster necrorhizus MCA 3950]KAG7439994.1 hypothetical protein BT62DRAFT_957411 [Guyanagaster necrorhizus MCA 3950]
MPLYEMVCIAAHNQEYARIKALVSLTASHIMNAGGVVRKIESWGTHVLPHRMHRHSVTHKLGDYWSLHFDTSPRTLRSLNRVLRQDPLVVRWTILRQGQKIEDVAAKGRSLIHPGDQFL